MSEEIKTLIDQFVSDKNSICREERQYALYLYNALLAYQKGGEDADSDIKRLVEKILPPTKVDDLNIDSVFYEATFMRDLHEYNKRCYFLKNPRFKEKNDNLYEAKDPSIREYGEGKGVSKEDDLRNSFNWKLYCYLDKNREKLYDLKALGITENKLDEYFEETEKQLNFIKDDGIQAFREEFHLGQKKSFIAKEDSDEQSAKNKNIVKQDIRSMMNAKPDIAIIYHCGNEEDKYLLFLECKFESGESKDGIRLQTHIQYMIADFLCSEWDGDNGKKSKLTLNNKEFGCKISSLMDGQDGALGQALKVVFHRGFNQNDDGKNIKIDIEDLIKINNQIFGREKNDKNQNPSR